MNQAGETSQLLPASPLRVADAFVPEADVVLSHSDVNAFIATLPDRSVNLIVSSPPYNIGKDYETRVSIERYLEAQAKVIAQMHRVLSDKGSICWQVGNFVEGGEIIPLDVLYYPIFQRLGMKMRNRIVWHFAHGLHASRRFSGRYEMLLWFTKSDSYTFNLDSVRVPSKYPGKLHYKGDNKGKPSGNPLGKNPSDVWEIMAQEWEDGFWDIPNVKANHPEKTAHPCQFPVELVERCVLALTDEGDRVFDPYMGVGSAPIAAIRHGRRAVGCERDAAYVEIARERVWAYRNGTLRVRPLGKPVHTPTGREKVAQVPVAWRTATQESLLGEGE